ncbi:MAG: ATP-binding cassette domain-containing protein, partial [Rhodocyclaceae bacterium]|nr:ATP-binding cassette domain-containing protein [Rhodocyclaceae bacterium]
MAVLLGDNGAGKSTLLAAQAQRLALDPEALRRPARTYSKGMTRKLALTAAFVSAAQLLVLDEP